ncbi:MAG: peptidylprolyl isomerase [Proteobacteria bacterium]|nr:peptidylprolyl isomerase [Pseudomonadota bacterium]MBU1059821.1 peptidylprolyl isomerase [Pseudomonadota bacterium]
MTQAKNGDKVQVHYKGTLKDGTVFDTSEGKPPLNVTVGSGQVIPGFDVALLGMKVGEKKTVVIAVDQAYGPHNPEMVMQLPANQIPPDLNPEIGQRLEVGGAGGEVMVVEVVDLNDEFIVLDANAPLAGKELTFELELVAIA